MVYFDRDDTKAQTAVDCQSKPKRMQERKRRPHSVYVVTTRVVYEMYHCDEWVHVPDSDDETNVVEAYIHKPSCDVLANAAAMEENAVLKFWKKEGRDVEQAATEVVIDLTYLRRSIVTCDNVRVMVSVELTKTKLKS